MNNNNPILKVDNLIINFPIRKGFFNKENKYVQAVNNVSFEIFQGEAIGLVGESGSGKTTIARGILRLINTSFLEGEVNFLDQDIFSLDKRGLKTMRRNIQVIFQDPYSSLNPRMTIGKIIEEGLIIHKIGNKKERRDKVIEIMERVGLNKDFYNRYPHEFSGGQRQRIGIARALILKPKLVLCDEPVSALDVSIQVQVLKLMQELQKEFNLTYLFIAHDLSVVDYFCSRIMVIYLGSIVEIASNDEIVNKPLHPYTQALISVVPQPDPEFRKDEIILEGDIPSPINPPDGCRFHTRCFKVTDKCKKEVPLLEEITEGHFCACFNIND